MTLRKLVAPAGAAGLVAAGLVVGALLAPTPAGAAGPGAPASASRGPESAAVAGCGTSKGTVRAFRTPRDGVAINTNDGRTLGTLNTACYSKIRIFARERAGLATRATIRIAAAEGGGEWVGELTRFTLNPNSERTLVIDVPATTLYIFADAGSTGSGVKLDVFVYGARY